MDVYRTFSKHMIMNSKKTVRMKLAVFLLTFITNILIITFFSYVDTSKLRLFELYGEWRYVIVNHIDEQAISKGISSNIAMITMKNNNNEYVELGPISTLNEKAEELFHIQLLLGRMPEKETEIAAEATTLSALGIDYTVGQTITLPVNGTDTMRYELVGIIKPYRYQWCLSDKSIIPTAIVKKEASQEKFLWLDEQEYHKQKQNISTLGFENTFAYDQDVLSSSMHWFYIVLFVTMLLVVYIFIFFISKNSFHFIKLELDILDKLGISLQDKKSIKKWTLFYLCKSSIPVSFLLSITISYFISLAFHHIIITIPIPMCMIATLCVLGIIWMTFPLKQETHHKKVHTTFKKKQRYLFFMNKKFNVLSYMIRKIQIFKFHYICLLVLTCIYVFVTIFCLFSYVKSMEKSKIELTQENEFDYIISFQNYYEHEKNPYGINPNDIDTLKIMETIEDVFTVKMNDANYTYENQEKSESWKNYIEYLQYNAEHISSNDKERKSPFILGFSESDYIKKIMEPYTVKDLWRNSYGLVSNLYYHIEYIYDEVTNSYGTMLHTVDNDSEDFMKDAYLKENTILNMSNDVTISSSVLNSFSFIETLKLTNQPYTVSVGEQTFQKIFPDHTNVQFVYIKTNDEANFITDQQIMNMFSKYENIHVENNRLHKENIKHDLHMQLLLTSMIQVIATIGWILFYIRISSLKEASTRKMKQILVSLGIDQKFFIWNAFMEAACISMIGCICAYVSYEYFIKHMVFETVLFEIVQTHMIKDYIHTYDGNIIAAVLCIVCLICILEFTMQKERSK